MNKKRLNNCNKVIEYIKENGSITTDIARFKLKVRRLGARIYDIRHIMKIGIISTMYNSDGDRYAIYTFDKLNKVVK